MTPLPPIRPGGVADAAACHAVYVDAVRNGTAPHYSAREALAWAPSATLEDWMAPRLAAGITWVAQSGARAEGFLTVTPAGHLDFLFVRPEWRGTGLAAALYDRMADWAAAAGHDRLTVHASHLSRRFLARRGWQVVARESVARHGVDLVRWEMEWRRPAAAD